MRLKGVGGGLEPDIKVNEEEKYIQMISSRGAGGGGS